MTNLCRRALTNETRKSVDCYKNPRNFLDPSSNHISTSPHLHISNLQTSKAIMFYALRPQSPYALIREHPVYVDPEDEYVERKRREYLAALEQQQRRAYDQALEAEQERHRTRLAALAQQERIRRYAPQFHRRSLPSPHTFACAGPSCAPTNIVRGRYNRQRGAPHCRASAPAPFPQRPRPQSEEATLNRLFAELFGHYAHGVRIPPCL